MQNDKNAQGFRAFVRGEITADLQLLHEQIQLDIERVEAQQAALRTGSRMAIYETLSQIVDERSQPEANQPKPDMDRLLKPGGIEHMHMPLLEASSHARIPAWLHGEAGSGKSTAAENIADMFGWDFRSISLCPTTSKSDILGYRDATGQYRSTGFRNVYENGGVFLFDEIDNAHPSSLAVVNHALANTIAEFPDKSVERHPDAIIIAAANTLGRGANAQYVGRAVIDAATRDRFVYIPWDIDEALEESLITVSKAPDISRISLSEGGVPSAKKWLKIVRDHRRAFSELGIRQLASPRATLYGCKLAELGVGEVWLKELCIYKGMGESERNKVAAHIDNPHQPVENIEPIRSTGFDW